MHAAITDANVAEKKKIDGDERWQWQVLIQLIIAYRYFTFNYYLIATVWP